jgi:RNA-binding protein YhbY
VPRRSVVEAVHGKPSVRIGKGGLHRGLINEVKRRLKEEGTIKIRVLKSYLTVSGKTVDEIAGDVARAVDAEVVTVRGRVFILRKRGW